MPYCTNCGSDVSQFAAACPDCGAPQQKATNNNNNYQERAPQRSYQPDDGGFGWGLLGFCIPVVGLILYLVWKDERPLTAHAAGKGALISVIFSVVVYVLYFIFIFAFVATGGY